MTEVLIDLFQRDLNKLKEEIQAYTSNEQLWLLDGEIKNTGGNLALHLSGNLRHFIGHIIGKTDYVRDRDREFDVKGLSIEELCDDIDACLEEVVAALNSISTEDLSKPYPIELFGKPMTYAWFLMHLSTHLSYHLGQVNYHRRIISK